MWSQYTSPHRAHYRTVRVHEMAWRDRVQPTASFDVRRATACACSYGDSGVCGLGARHFGASRPGHSVPLAWLSRHDVAVLQHVGDRMAVVNVGAARRNAAGSVAAAGAGAASTGVGPMQPAWATPMSSAAYVRHRLKQVGLKRSRCPNRAHFERMERDAPRNREAPSAVVACLPVACTRRMRPFAGRRCRPVP